MKAMSVWQPWASAIASGAKRYETRSWATRYRGPIAICAAKKVPTTQELALVPGTFQRRDVWWKLVCDMAGNGAIDQVVPYGAIVSVGRLTECVAAESIGMMELHAMRTRSSACMDGRASLFWEEWQLGDFSPGRFAWRIEDVVRLASPVPVTGRQGLFDIPDHLVPAYAVFGPRDRDERS